MCFDSAVFICAHLNASKTSIKIKLWVPVGLLITFFFSTADTFLHVLPDFTSQRSPNNKPTVPPALRLKLLTLGAVAPRADTLISWSSKWIQMRLVRPPGLNGPLVYTLVRQLSGESGPRYPQRWRDVLKTCCASEAGKCTMFRQSLSKIRDHVSVSRAFYLAAESNCRRIFSLF